MITREPELQFLIRNKDSEKIKILCGMRGSGKTLILAAYRRYLSDTGVPEARIFHADLAAPAYRHLTAHELYRKIYDAYPDGRPAYIFLDDILRFEGCERLVDGLYRIANFDIYLTVDGGPKSLAPLLATLPGRCLYRTVYPFSYAEIVGKPSLSAFLSYAESASLPAAYEKEETSALDAAVSAAIYHEIMDDANIRKALLEKILTYLSPKTGDILDMKDLARYAGRTGRPLLSKTLVSYLSALEAGGLLLIAPAVKLSDTETKEKFPTRFRAFFPDTAMTGLFGEGVGAPYRKLLNTVAVELWRRSDTVQCAETEAGPVDFLTEKDSLRSLIQCIPRFDAPDAETKIRALAAAPDSFKKIILTLTPAPAEDAPGIIMEYLPAWMVR